MDKRGRLDLDMLADSLTDDVAIVSVMWANNETGTIFPSSGSARWSAARDCVPYRRGAGGG